MCYVFKHLVMKKYFLTFAAILFSTFAASAMGPVDFGVKAGINTGNFRLKNSALTDNLHIINEARTGYHAGVFMRLSALGLHVQPELVYNWNKYNTNVWRSETAGSDEIVMRRYESKISVQTLEVPVLVGIEILFLRLNAGPVFNIMNKTSSSGGIVRDADVMKPSVSFAAGAGIDLMKFSLDVRFNGQFKRAQNNLTIDDSRYNFKSNFRGWTFSLGYKF